MEEDQSILNLMEKYDDRNPHIDFEAFWNYWKGELSDNTIVQYIRYLSNLDFDPLADRPQPELLEDDANFSLEDFKEWVRETSRKEFGTDSEKRNTINRFQYNVYLALKKYLESKNQSDLLDNLPSSSAFTKPTSKDQTIKYDEEQLQKLVESTDDSTLELSIALMAYSGLRAYEVLNITPEWIEFKEDRIDIEIPPEYAKGRKNNAENEDAFLSSQYEEKLKKHIKSVYETEESYDELIDQAADEDNYRALFNFIKCSEKTFEDLHKERYQINKSLKDLAKKAGLNKADKISAHKLRKSFIHHVQNNTKDLSKTAQLARHKDASTTQKFYLQLDKEAKAKTYSEIF